MAKPTLSFDVPFREPITESNRMLTRAWEWFFNSVFERLYPLGIERSFTIVNNTSAAADVAGLKFNSRGVSMAIVDFLIQRVTTGSGAVELTEAGFFTVLYQPTSASWILAASSLNSPEDSGVTFSITATGQVRYTSTNVGGTASISKLYYRARTLGGKSSGYSSVGAR